MHELKRLFTTAISLSELEHEIVMAEAVMENERAGTAFPDSTFEDGYIAALNFVLGREGSNVREEYEALNTGGEHEQTP